MQLHPTSLPGGRLGAEAYAWVDWLADAGQSWWQMLPLGPPDRYGSPYKARSAFAAWPALLADPAAPVTKAEELDFREREAAWIEDWGALGGRDAVADQVRFDREWGALRAYAAERGVRLIGDVPIYVAPGSRRPPRASRALPRRRRRRHAAGRVHGQGPAVGQPAVRLAGAAAARLPLVDRAARRTFALFDLARIDHFRGFVVLLGGARRAPATRCSGRWQRGPGRALFDAARAALGELPLIAEDLGVITPAVERLRDALGLPGMVVLQFGFDPGDPRNPHDVANHAEHRVAYTGTHDNDTRARLVRVAAAGPPRAASTPRRRRARDEEVWWDLIALTFSSRGADRDGAGAGRARARLEARMNTPGTATGAWQWGCDELPCRRRGGPAAGGHGGGRAAGLTAARRAGMRSPAGPRRDAGAARGATRGSRR